ncbi:hypothetical protein KEG38_23990 [Polyangium jinanense]|uniref:GTPase domain-containing protein n=1 Tax=Polyangium jinanense TaxID=2829994 RepID=UPI00234099B2|nr:GTPase domain-containing protein [Polyangium jinanense]MDC3956943.1 hypothetical protein [Polyangium jinanense]
MLVTIIVIAVAAALVGVLVLVGLRAANLGKALEAAEHKIESLQGEVRALHGKNAALKDESDQKDNWLDNLDKDVTHLRSELDKRPIQKRKSYRILTLGMKATGKTSLTLKWSNPLVDLGTIEGTKIERYERSVSHVREKDTLVEHVFEVHDWGGEHIVDALQELMVEEIHGLLVVVDLGGREATQVEMGRVSEQLQEFQPQALRYFFGPKTLASCKSVVLFINKSDLIAGTPTQVEEEAKRLYQPLIDSLMKYANQIDVRVFVGSANYGHSTHLLFSHFVEKILPKNAYDPQLLQRMKSDFGQVRALPSAAQAMQLPPVSSGTPAPPVAAPVAAAPPVAPSFGPPPGRVAPSSGLRPQIPHFGNGTASIGDTAPLLHRTAPLYQKA